MLTSKRSGVSFVRYYIAAQHQHGNKQFYDSPLSETLWELFYILKDVYFSFNVFEDDSLLNQDLLNIVALSS